jgi:hypothetical protein
MMFTLVSLYVTGGVLGEDGDAALALEVVAVHHARLNLLVVAEHLALREHRVHQRGLAVVDVRDDGDVAHVTGAARGQRRQPRARPQPCCGPDCARRAVCFEARPAAGAAARATGAERAANADMLVRV